MTADPIAFVVAAALERFADANPTYLVVPIQPAQAAAVAGIEPGTLATRRFRGQCPGHCVRLGALGSFYPSRHHVLAATRRDYPLARMSHVEFLERQIAWHPEAFDRPLRAKDLQTDAFNLSRNRKKLKGTSLGWLAEVPAPSLGDALIEPVQVTCRFAKPIWNWLKKSKSRKGRRS